MANQASFESAAATLLERTLNIQGDISEIKSLLAAQNGRIKKLEDEVLTAKVTKKVVLAMAAAVGSLVTFLGNIFLGGIQNGR